MAFKISSNLSAYRGRGIARSRALAAFAPKSQCASNGNGRATAALSRRGFGEGEEVRRPKVFKNVFNKWESRDGKRVFFTTFPHDYNEPWPFRPVYNRETGADLNQDDVWGDGGDAPPCSITGKPKRALGHYPWLGRPIVPYDDHHRWIFDEQVAPMPLFAAGRYEANRTFYWQWILSAVIFFGTYYIIDVVWRGDGKWGNLSKQRDELWFTEHMASPQVTWQPLAWAHYANPCAPIVKAHGGKDRWCIVNSFVSNRYDNVFIPAAKEDMFADETPHFFKMPGYNC